jgi:hypothetical protein
MDNEPKRKWFLWGMVLAWTPSIPIIIGVLDSFRGVSEQKATGPGAIAGGFADAYLIFGLILAFVFPVGAVVLLARSFSGGHGMRALISVLSLCWSTVMLSIAGGLMWWFLVGLPHRAIGPQ